MAEMTEAREAPEGQLEANKAAQWGYDHWIKSTGLPIHTGYFLDDLRNIELGWWQERQCNAAFLQLEGQQGVAEARVTEIPPGKTLPRLQFALDDVVYVVDGRGFCTVSSPDGRSSRTFEWQKHSLFLLPRNHPHQLSNAHGDKPARLLHNNYLPVAMVGIPDPELYFNNGIPALDRLQGDFYSEATVSKSPSARGRVRAAWIGNFFPDMRAWDKLVPFFGRGAGGQTVFIEFPNSPMTCHMSVFDAGTYKKGHRHGPGFVIVIPKGEGYSIMWPDENAEKVVIPWHEGSVFVPPDRWFHQHFNVGSEPARYLALHPPRQFSGIGERVADPASNQIEYPDEEPSIREKFESELAARGMTSLMPQAAYEDPAFEWDYGTQE